MKNITLKVIPEPKPNSCTIFEFRNGAKFKGQSGEVVLVCGGCERNLAEKVEEGQLRNLVISCECGAYNRIPMTWERFRLQDVKEKWNLGVLFLGLLLLIASQFVQEYSNATFWVGLILALLSTLSLLAPKKIVRYFSED